MMEKLPVDLLCEALFDSKTLFKEMAILNPGAIQKTQNAFQFVQQHGIQAVLIGGMAVSHWSTDRTLTPDVDFLTPDLNQVKQILQQNNMQSSVLASSGAYGGIMVPQLDADFLDANQGNAAFNQYVLNTAVSTRIGGVMFKIIDPNVLTIMKFDLGRAKDTEDAFKLMQGGNVNKMAMRTHLKATKTMLSNEEAQTIWGYVQSMLTG